MRTASTPRVVGRFGAETHQNAFDAAESAVARSVMLRSRAPEPLWSDHPYRRRYAVLGRDVARYAVVPELGSTERKVLGTGIRSVRVERAVDVSELGAAIRVASPTLVHGEVPAPTGSRRTTSGYGGHVCTAATPVLLASRAVRVLVVTERALAPRPTVAAPLLCTPVRARSERGRPPGTLRGPNKHQPQSVRPHMDGAHSQSWSVWHEKSVGVLRPRREPWPASTELSQSRQRGMPKVPRHARREGDGTRGLRKSAIERAGRRRVEREQ